MKMNLVALLCLLLIIPLVSAVDVDIKDSLNKGETLLAKISGNFVEPIQKNDVLLYRGHERIPFDFEMTKIYEDYYIYSQLNEKTPGNYSIILENMIYYDFGEIVEEDIEENFSISSELADFTIEPGFIITKDDFYITVRNLRNSEINIYTEWGESEEESGGFFDALIGDDSTGNSSEISIGASEKEEILFEIEDTENTILTSIIIKTDNLIYEIPVLIEEENVQKEESMRLLPRELEVTISSDSETTRKVILQNTGEVPLSNISIELSEDLEPYISLSQEDITNLEENSTEEIKLNISTNGTSAFIEGQIIANTGFLYSYSHVILNFTESFIPSENGNESEEETIFKTCEEIEGVICEDGFKCSGETKTTKDGICCLETCEEVEKSNVGKIIGWLMIVVVVGFISWFLLKRYKGTKRPLDLFKIKPKKKH